MEWVKSSCIEFYNLNAIHFWYAPVLLIALSIGYMPFIVWVIGSWILATLVDIVADQGMIAVLLGVAPTETIVLVRILVFLQLPWAWVCFS